MTQRLQYSYIAVILVLYFGFHNSYRTEYIDDSWTLSWIYGAWVKGVFIDEISGLGKFVGTTLFSRGTVWLYGFIHDIFGWSRGVSFAISTLLLLVGTAVWYAILRQLGYSRETCNCFVLVMLVAEAYFGMGHKIRVDPLTFFLSASSFLLFLRRHFFLSGLLALVAMENHIMGVVVFFYVLAYLISIYKEVLKEPKTHSIRVLSFLSGCVIGFGFYLYVHWEYLSLFSELVNKWAGTGGNVITSYYFDMQYSWRHIPELVVILAAFGWFLWKRLYREDKFALPFFVCCCLLVFLLPRGNYHYMVYIYPSAILLILLVAQKQKLLNLFLISFLAFQLPQYGYLFWKQRGYDHEAYVEEVRKHVPKGETLIYGNPNAWFAFYDREFRAYGYWDRAEIKVADYPKEFILIENQEFREWGNSKALDKTLECCYTSEQIGSFTDYEGNPINIKRYFLTKASP